MAVVRQHIATATLLILVAAQLAYGALPGAPPKCTAAVRQGIDWGAGSNSFGVSGHKHIERFSERAYVKHQDINVQQLTAVCCLCTRSWTALSM
jgi:hypothetical protein